MCIECILSECMLHLDEIIILRRERPSTCVSEYASAILKKERLCEHVSEYVSAVLSITLFLLLNKTIFLLSVRFLHQCRYAAKILQKILCKNNWKNEVVLPCYFVSFELSSVTM